MFERKLRASALSPLIFPRSSCTVYTFRGKTNNISGMRGNNNGNIANTCLLFFKFFLIVFLILDQKEHRSLLQAVTLISATQTGCRWLNSYIEQKINLACEPEISAEFSVAPEFSGGVLWNVCAQVGREPPTRVGNGISFRKNSAE